MGKTVTVTCDGCGHDLTTRSNSVDYRLVLASEGKPGYGPGAYTDMMIYPPVDRAYYFCRLECLDHWRGRARHEAAAWAAWWAAWKRENGTQHGVKGQPGYTSSYPEPPRELRAARTAEFAAAALAAFPMAKPPA